MNQSHHPEHSSTGATPSGAANQSVTSPNEETNELIAPYQTQQLLHEVGIYQIELELQNQELRRVQEELIASRSLYFDLYHNAPIGFCTLNSAGMITQANLTATTLLGYAARSLVGQYFINLVHVEDLLIYRNLLEALTLAEDIQSCELRVKALGGFDFWVKLIAAQHLETNTEGSVSSIRLAVSDISQRINTEAALHLRSTALDATTNAVSIIDKSGVVELVNPAHVLLTGYTVEESIGKPMRQIGFFEDGSAFDDRLWRAILAGQTWQGELRDHHKSGEVFDTEMTITPLLSNKGYVTHAIIVQQDVSQRKLLEEQFRQSQKMQAFGDFAGGIAHDFNNILGTILMQADVMEVELGLPGPTRNGLEQIRKDAHRGADLVRHLLVFGRKQKPDFRNLDLNEIVRNLSKLMERLVGDGVKVRLSLASSRLIIRADSAMLDQVIMNLVSNSLDAMPDGGEIFIHTEERLLPPEQAEMMPTHDPRPRAVLRFEDTGCGISTEILEKIYEPFFTTKDIGKGTGLGLAIVYGIINQHKGSVRVESKVGRGTSFEILLPTSASCEIAPLAEPVMTELVGGEETILLVEDQATLRVLTGKILEKYGYTILYAGDGAEALEVSARHGQRIDLLMTDLQLPGGISGDILADRLSSHIPDLRTIFISGGSIDLSGDRLRLSAKRKFIKKPAFPRTLLDLIRNCLDA